jgi:hypothetical protein
MVVPLRYLGLKLSEIHDVYMSFMQSALRVFQNRVLRRIFGPKRFEEMDHWRKLHNEVLHTLYSTPNIIRVMKSRGIRWVGHTAYVGVM